MIDATVPVAWDDPGEKGESGRNKRIREKGRMIKDMIARKTKCHSKKSLKRFELQVAHKRLSTAGPFAREVCLKYELEDRYIKQSSLLHERPTQNYELRTEKEQSLAGWSKCRRHARAGDSEPRRWTIC